MIEIPTLKTDRLVLRPWRESDVEPLRGILDDPEVTRFLMGGTPPPGGCGGRGAYERRLHSWEQDGMGFWAVQPKDSDELAGWTGLQRVHYEEGLVGEAEVGWTFGRKWWGRGLAPEAAAAALVWGFETISLERIYAFCHPENAKSERVMRKLGMEPAGTTRDVRDGSPSTLYVMTAEMWRQRADQAFG